MKQYEEWDKIICGLMYYYGMVEMTTLHEYFMRATKRMLAYEEFETYVKCRCSFWSFGLFLRDVQRQREYYQCVNVDNPEMLLMYVRQHPDLPYNVSTKKTFSISARRAVLITAGRVSRNWAHCFWMRWI